MDREEVEIKNHQESLNRKKVRLISFISFLMGFAQSLVIYVLSSYFKEISGTENVGFFYFISYAFGLWLLLNLHKLIKKVGKSGTFDLSLVLKLVSIAFILILPEGYWTIVFLLIYLVSGAIEWASLDVILESFSVDNMSGRIRGKYLTFMNAGYILGPLLSSLIVEEYGFMGVFMVLFIINSLIMTVSLSKMGHVNHEVKEAIRVREIFEKIKERKNVLRIYYISFVLEFFFALMVIYTPIYLRNLGLGLGEVGLILSIMLIPFVLVQYPSGLIADKRLGEKEMIIASLCIMTASTVFMFFIDSVSIFLWSLVLFLTRVGAAMLEVLRDSYFYKRIDADDVDLNNFFRTALPVAYIISTLISTVLLFAFSVKAVFILVAIVVASAIFPAISLVDNKCERERESNK
jgi:MFS family permease